MKTLQIFVIASIAAVLSLVTSCGPSPESDPTSEGKSKRPTPPKDALVITFTYGSEKEQWITEATKSFNAAKHKRSDGKDIFVDAIPMGSGECIREILAAERETHITSPASEAFITLGNADSEVKLGKPLVSKTKALVLSPVIIAMWKPMAEALGWPDKPIGWQQIHEMATNPEGWASVGHPEWGGFRFGHTHPEFSNSGLISLLAESYAATGKRTPLTTEDVAKPETAKYLREIEGAVVHYGQSTGFFGKKMFDGGPSYLSAAVLYENMIIEGSQRDDLPFPVVAIYPKEGTFWSDHPVGIVERDYVTPAHQEAAKKYIDFLLSNAQQQAAMATGFRPADPAVALAAPIDLAHNVDPAQPQTTLPVPEANVIREVMNLWRANKKQAHVALVLDVSGSMQEDKKMENAREGALALLDLLDDRDHFTLIPFNDSPKVVADNLEVGPNRSKLRSQISGLFANGGTALYDATAMAHGKLASFIGDNARRITSVVVLSDGDNTAGQTTLPQLSARIGFNETNAGIRVFTIGYGKNASDEVLGEIAEITRAKYYKGSTTNIREIFREIATFF